MLAASVFMLLGLKAAAARPAVDLTPGSNNPAPVLTPLPIIVPAIPPPASATPRALAATPRLEAAPARVFAPLTPPVAAVLAVRSIRTVETPETYVEWGCDEDKTANLSFSMPSGARFVSAEFEVLQVDKAKSYVRKGPRPDPDGRTVLGEVVFRGLDRVFFNCPGAGHARLRLKVTLESP